MHLLTNATKQPSKGHENLLQLISHEIIRRKIDLFSFNYNCIKTAQLKLQKQDLCYDSILQPSWAFWTSR